MTLFKDFCIDVFSRVDPRATFLSIAGYKNNWDEKADFSVVFHVNYLNAVRKSQQLIMSKTWSRRPLCGRAWGFMPSDVDAARVELLDSYQDTLNGYNPLYTCRKVYEPILDANGEPIPGVKLHSRLDEIHINAMRIRKKVLIKGDYKKRDSSPKTLAKNWLRSFTPLSKWVQFKLVPLRFDELVVQKMRIKG